MCNTYTNIYGVEMDMETMGRIPRTQCVTHIHVSQVGSKGLESHSQGLAVSLLRVF